MTRREAILSVLNRAHPERPPVSVRIELWYADAVSKNALPQEISELSREEVEDYLGFCRAARHRTQARLKFKNIEVRERQEGDEVIKEYLFGSRTLTRRTRRSHEVTASHIVNYPLETEADYDRMLSKIEDAHLDFDVAGFDALDTHTGDVGLPVLILHSCPAHLIMLQWAGHERFFLHLMDFPDKVEALYY